MWICKVISAVSGALSVVRCCKDSSELVCCLKAGYIFAGCLTA